MEEGEKNIKKQWGKKTQKDKGGGSEEEIFPKIIPLPKDKTSSL